MDLGVVVRVFSFFLFFLLIFVEIGRFGFGRGVIYGNGRWFCENARKKLDIFLCLCFFEVM